MADIDGLLTRLDMLFLRIAVVISLGVTCLFFPFMVFTQFWLAPEPVRNGPILPQVLNLAGVVLYTPFFIFGTFITYRALLGGKPWKRRYPVLGLILLLWAYVGPAVQKAFWTPIYNHYGIEITPAMEEELRRRQGKPTAAQPSTLAPSKQPAPKGQASPQNKPSSRLLK